MSFVYYNQSPIIKNSLIHSNETLKTILETFPGDVFCCGGYPRDLISKHKTPKDIDLFFRNVETLTKVYHFLRGEKFKESHTVDYIRESKNFYFRIGDVVFNLIGLAYYDSIEECLDSFNFTINMVGFNHEKLVSYSTFSQHLSEKKLVVHSLGPIPWFLYSMQKYNEYGYKMSYYEAKKLAMRMKLGSYDETHPLCDYINMEAVNAA